MMEDRPERIADYFVVVGLSESTATKFEPFSATDEQVGQPGDVVSSNEGAEPLTDIALIHSKLEQLPKGYR